MRFSYQPDDHKGHAFSKYCTRNCGKCENFEGYVVLYPVNRTTEVSSSGRVFF